MRHAKDTANETAKETATTETTTTDTTEATVGEGEMAVDYELDQIVWVRTGGNHEEPGTVLQIGGEADDGMRRRGTAAEFLSAGEYLVRLHGSAYPVAVEAAQLRSLAEATLSNTTTTTTTVVRRTSRRRAANRSVVTPSPGPDKPGATTTTEQPNGKRSPTLEDRIAIATDCSVTAPASSTDATFTTIATTGSARANQRPKRAATTATLRMPPSSKPPSPSSKRQATESAVRKRGQQKIDVDDDDASVEEEDYSVKATPPPTTAMKLVPVRNRPPPAVAAMANTENGIYDNNNNNNNEASEEEDDDDDNDRPFTIDYSPSARSTCRRCDECIGKGSLRISHVPLFRGKPGYRVYRHLECAVFAPDIVQTAHDVGGWKKLNAADYKALVVRVEESKIEIEKENEELEPDELVQTAFEGEIRGLPPNMVAGLLPFQIEGHSWMYHQEYHVPTIRGGILADEMGMVRSWCV